MDGQNVYVSNEFVSNDLMWINNQDGTFTNRIKEYLKHQTFNGIGRRVADYNNDGLADVVNTGYAASGQ
ncbi:MAG: VCBS repeat-containing protein [Saprospiraceae bacterium]|nr:VCBS repeat-containing protein [Saprospiraceae bacterium]